MFLDIFLLRIEDDVILIESRFFCFNILGDFLNLFLERGGRENERERNIDVREKHQFVALACTPAGE